MVDNFSMRLTITVVLTLFIGSSTYAAKVLSVKGQRVLMDSEGEVFNTGDRLGLRNSSGKAIGLVVIEKTKGDRIIGRVQRGTAVKGATGALLGANASASTSSAKRGSSGGGRRISANSSFGILGGLTMTTQNLKTTSLSNSNLTVDVAAEGTSLNLLGFYQMPLSDSLGLRVMGGMESIDIEGTVNGEKHFANIKYLAVNSLIKYNYYSKPDFELWAGLGLSFMMNMSESQNVYQTSPKMLNSILLSLGGDIRVGRKSYIPLHFDYGYFQDTNTVKTSQMMFRGGWAWNF